MARNNRVHQSKRGARRDKSPPPEAQTAILEVTALGRQGDGIAHHNGNAVHIPLTAPGDRITARIAGEYATLTEIVSPGSSRVVPGCPHFGQCGGCRLQHLSSSFQRDWKTELVTEALVREGLSDVAVTMGSALPIAVRRRATFAVRRDGSKVKLGFRQRKAHKIIDLAQCDILHPDLLRGLNDVRPLLTDLPDGWHDYTVQVTLADNGLDVHIRGDVHLDNLQADHHMAIATWLEKTACVRVAVNGEVVCFSQMPVVQFGEGQNSVNVPLPVGAFLQASREGQGALLRAVAEIVKTEVPKASRIADLFCGSGAFALPMANDYRVFAYDSEAPAIEALTQAARQAGLGSHIAASVRDLYRQPLSDDELGGFAAIIMDPPRAGAPAQAKSLAKSSVPLIVSVSCDARSFARDARLLGKGGYSLSRVTLVDQFAHSPHIEMVGAFRKEVS